VLNAAALGHVAGLSHTSEVDIADKLSDIIPCAEQVRFLKSGAEAVAAASALLGPTRARTASSRPGISDGSTGRAMRGASPRRCAPT
jgi:glutamate-1-semialdehyde aminotransferase